MTSLILNRLGEQYISRRQKRDPYERLKKWLRFTGEKVQYINEDEFENLGIEEFGIEDEDIEKEHIAILKEYYNLKHGDIVYTRNRDSYIYNDKLSLFSSEESLVGYDEQNTINYSITDFIEDPLDFYCVPEKYNASIYYIGLSNKVHDPKIYKSEFKTFIEEYNDYHDLFGTNGRWINYNTEYSYCDNWPVHPKYKLYENPEDDIKKTIEKFRVPFYKETDNSPMVKELLSFSHEDDTIYLSNYIFIYKILSLYSNDDSIKSSTFYFNTSNDEKLRISFVRDTIKLESDNIKSTLISDSDFVGLMLRYELESVTFSFPPQYEKSLKGLSKLPGYKLWFTLTLFPSYEGSAYGPKVNYKNPEYSKYNDDKWIIHDKIKISIT